VDNWLIRVLAGTALVAVVKPEGTTPPLTPSFESVREKVENSLKNGDYDQALLDAEEGFRFSR
jgi:hypothetical protein